MIEVGGGIGVPLVQGREAIQVRGPHQKQVTKLETWSRGQESRKYKTRNWVGPRSVRRERRKISALVQQ